MSTKRICYICSSKYSSAGGDLLDVSGYSEKTLMRILETVMTAPFIVTSTDLCDRCVTMLESYDKLTSKAHEVKERIEELMNLKDDYKEEKSVESQIVEFMEISKTEVQEQSDEYDEDIPEYSDGEEHKTKKTKTPVKPAKSKSHSSSSNGFKCNQCDSVLKTKKNLRVHIKTVHETDQKPKHSYEWTICDICGGNFRNANLQNHRNACVRRSTCDLTCPLCPKKLKDYDAVKKHRAFHKEMERREKAGKASCDICGKEFYAGYKMQRHMVSHGSVKAFGCPLCNVRYNNNWNVLQHMKKFHEENYPAERRFKCTLCEDKEFKRVSLFRVHMEKVHQFFNVPS